MTNTIVKSKTSSMWDEYNDVTPANYPKLQNSTEVDVAIVGGGYTGLWAAYYLKKRKPSLKIAIFEAEHIGYGASGRNGGWASAIFPASMKKVAKNSSRDAAIRMQLAMNETLAELEKVISAENIDCDFKHGGYLSVIRNQAQLTRAAGEIADWKSWGFGEDQISFLSRQETTEKIGASKVLGATFTPHCAALHPNKLVNELARVVNEMGVTIYENTRVNSIESRKLQTHSGTVKAEHIVLGTEAYTCTLPGMHRNLVPMQSLMIATEPLTETQLESIGLENRQTFSDKRHARIYGQLTADNRLAFGGRGAPYNFSSKINGSNSDHIKVHDMLEKSLKDFFPAIKNTQITHRWSGYFGIPRDWYPGLLLDRNSGIIQNTGYVGDGVTSTNLAGRTISDFILGETAESSDLLSLPWVNKKAPKWEIEPFRWVAVNAVSELMLHGDKTENRTGKPSKLVSSFWKAIGI